MLQYKWISTTITTNRDANGMIEMFKRQQPKVGGQDTETTGLHIINDVPFVFQFGWLHPSEPIGYTFAVDLERQPQLAREVIKRWLKLAESLEINFGHNVKYELHMNTNLGFPPNQNIENWSDTMFYIRYAHDALTPANGGPPLKLKDYCAQYITHTAKDHERMLDQEKTAIAKDLNYKLRLRLKDYKPPERFGAKSYTLAVIQDIFKDPIADVHDLPEDIRPIYLKWLHEDVPDYIRWKVAGLVESDMIPYNKLNRQQLITYAHMDIVLMLEVYLKLKDVLIARGNEKGVQIENELIFPLYEMERVGFVTDKAYIEDCRIAMKTYIIQQRQKLHTLAGQIFSIGQHELIKSILLNDFQVPVSSTNSEELDLLVSDLTRENPEHPAIEFINLLQELRTLEKWYSTYIMRFTRDLKFNDRLYTTINQVGTVSGRVTSDFQQFPKEGIKTMDGQELFHPRKMIINPGGNYDGIIYLDYSQIELRFQAFYTILVGNPDLNLCRAYMPYQCVDANGIQFDCNSPEHIRRWAETWHLREALDIPWIPTDVHGATTTKATGLGTEHPDFKKLRSEIGKRVNFAKNYGAQRKKIRQMFPKKTEEEVTRIDNAYYEAFPGVKTYHQYCYDRAASYSYTANLFGVRYYGVSGHKLINMLIQGSAAYYLKLKIRELYLFFREKKLKSRFQMNIHDELSWEKWYNEIEVFFQVKEIMEDWSDTLVPIVAEMSYTKTTWEAKKEVHNLNDLQLLISS